MKNCLRLTLCCLSLVAIASGYVYQCEQGTDPSMCSIWNFPYAPNDNPLPVVNIPGNVKRVRIAMERYYYQRRLHITTYDATLHSTILHNPTVVEVTNNRINDLHMPADLQEGYFTNNAITNVLTNASVSYAVAFLDLSHNSLVDMDGLAALVHLKTLNLEGNRIGAVTSDTFMGMHNLTRLYLSDNVIAKVDFHRLPQGLVSLWLLRNALGQLNLSGAVLPALTDLDLELNELSTLDVAELRRAFPALRVLPIAYNPLPRDEAKRVVAELKRHNVSLYFAEQTGGCDSDEYELDHVCFPGSMLVGSSVAKALFLLVVAIVVLGVFAASVQFVWTQMRY